MNNVTTATFTGSGRKAEACPLFQYDFGQILKIEGLELPPLYEVDFGNDRSSGTSITVLGDADGVEIPNQLLETGEYVFAWIVLHEGEDDRETEYMVEIPVIRRAEPSDEEPTPEQMTIIEQLTAEVAVLKEEISEISGISEDVKTALLQIAAKVAYIDDDGQDYYDALEAALYPPANLVSISAVYTQSGTVYETDSLDSLKTDLVVTALYDDTTTETVTTYTLSGTLTEGTSTITVSYGGKTTTFTVTVTSKYTYYDYIAMTYADAATIPSNCGIHTDIGLTTEDTLETSIKYSSNTDNNACVMGIRNGKSGTKEFALFCNGSLNKLGYWYDNTDTTQILSYLVKNQVNTIKVQPVGVSQTYPSNATININGTDYSTGSTSTGQTFDSWLGFFKYGINATQTSTGTFDKYCTAQIGETIIKDLSNNILHDLKPAYDGERYGLYDSVGDKFYYNATYADKYICGNWT